MFLLWAIALSVTQSLLSGEPEHNLSSDFNHMLLGVFVVVIEAQKLDICIHKQSCTVEKLSEIQSKYTSDDTDSIPIRIICARLDPTEKLTVQSLEKSWTFNES